MLQGVSEGRALTPVQEESQVAGRGRVGHRPSHTGDDLVLRAASREKLQHGHSVGNLSARSNSSVLSKGGSSRDGGGQSRGGTAKGSRGSTLPQDPTGLLPRLQSKGDQQPDPKELIQLFRLEEVPLAEIEGVLKRRPGLVNSKEETFGWPPLMFAATKGNLPLLKRILDAKADHRVACHNGNTALQLAARGGHTGVVQYLLSVKASVNAKNKNGWNALTWGASGGHEEAVEVLLEANASATVKDEQGRTACMWAARNGHADCVRAIAASGLDLSVRDSSDLTVADHARNFHELRLTILAFERANQRLLDAAKSGNLTEASLALEEGAAVNTKTAEGGTALLWAVAHGSGELAKLLLKHGARPSGDGAEAQEAELVEGGLWTAELTQRAVDGAMGVRQRFINAAMDGDWEEARHFLEEGAYVDTADEGSRTAFVWAAVHGSYESLLWLAEASADLNRRDASGWSAAHHAAQKGELETVSALYHLGADFLARTHEGQTLQHLAAAADGGQTLQLLAAARADFAIQDADDLVPAQVAAKKGCDCALATLLALKASATVKDLQNRSLFSLATIHGHVAVCRLLVAQMDALPWADCAGCVAKTEGSGKAGRLLSKKRGSVRRSVSRSSSVDSLGSAATPRRRDSQSLSPDGTQRKSRKSLGTSLLPALPEQSIVSPKTTATPSGSRRRSLSKASNASTDSGVSVSSGLLPALPGKSTVSPKTTMTPSGSRRRSLSKSSNASDASGGGRSVHGTPKASKTKTPTASSGTWASLVETAFAKFESLPSRFAAPFTLSEALTQRDKDGCTALVLSVKFNQPRVQALLLELKAAPDAEDAEGNTALMLGAARGDRGAVDLLLEAEASTEARNKAGKRSWEVAKQNDLRQVLKADLDRKLVAQRLGKSASLPALAATTGDLSSKLQMAQPRPQLLEGLRRFRLEGLQGGDRIVLEARIRTLFPGSCGAKLMHVSVGVDPITQSCRGFAHVDLAFLGKQRRLHLDGRKVELLLGDRVRVVEEHQA